MIFKLRFDLFSVPVIISVSYVRSSVLAALVAPLVSALTVSQPTQAVNNGGSMTFSWTTQAGDPSTFSVYLKNPTFNDVFGVANNVDASQGTLTIQVPAVPDNQQYTIILVPINNVNQVLAQSPPFNIGANQATTASSSAASLTATSAAGTLSSASTPATPTRPSTPSATSGFGTVISPSATPSRSGSTSASTAPASQTSNSAALPVRFSMNMGVVVSMALSVFAGAAAIAL
ncbi:hypothetical protein AN958_11823 [Leucoagaricus sp. SymC.cos]|nr:hypothetical protein AN958_11823 [Leucoagaricus sp. SymC.cos]